MPDHDPLLPPRVSLPDPSTVLRQFTLQPAQPAVPGPAGTATPATTYKVFARISRTHTTASRRPRGSTQLLPPRQPSTPGSWSSSRGSTTAPRRRLPPRRDGATAVCARYRRIHMTLHQWQRTSTPERDKNVQRRRHVLQWRQPCEDPLARLDRPRHGVRDSVTCSSRDLRYVTPTTQLVAGASGRHVHAAPVNSSPVMASNSFGQPAVGSKGVRPPDSTWTLTS